MSLNISNK